MTKNTRTRILLVAVASLLLVVMAVGGTIAYLQDSSEIVTNTFKGSELAIEMWESPLKTGADYDGKTIDTTAEDVQAETNYKMVPGVTLQKDPYAVVEAGSEPCYVFVVVTKTNDFDKYMTENYNTTDWKLVTGYTNVWAYKTEVDALAAEQKTSSILAADAIKVNEDLSNEDLDITAYPTLSFKAYAIQSQYLTENAYTIDANAAEIFALLGTVEGAIKTN